MKKFLACIAIAFFFLGCTPGPGSESSAQIVCTTGMLGDAVKNLAGDSLSVVTLMGPGVDPHLYKATQGDIQLLSQAEVIVYNGLHLEGKMGEIFEKLQNRKLIVAAADGVEPGRLINSTDFSGAYDPHIWFDVSVWMDAVGGISRQLQQKYPHLSAYIRNNELRYRSELEDLHGFCIRRIESIPDNQRVIITAHDAFKYFGRAYGMQVRGLQGISTTAEYGLRDISQLVQFIVDHRIKAIFVESSVPKRSIEAVIEGCRDRGHEVKLGGELFSDAMGGEGTPEGTYTGMVRHNVNTIVEALK